MLVFFNYKESNITNMEMYRSINIEVKMVKTVQLKEAVYNSKSTKRNS